MACNFYGRIPLVKTSDNCNSYVLFILNEMVVASLRR